MWSVKKFIVNLLRVNISKHRTICSLWCLYIHTVSSRKYATHFCTLFWDKSGEGAFAQIFNSSGAYVPPLFLTIFNRCKVNNRDDCCGFLKKRQLRWTCTPENQWYLDVLILSQEASKASYIPSGDRGWPCVSSRFQCEQQKPWWWPANKAIVICVYVFTNIIDDGAKPKAH